MAAKKTPANPPQPKRNPNAGKAPTSTRSLWKGAISFGLVHVPMLREALAATRKVGVAKVVIANKQHLALLMPCGPALVLNLLRWGGEIRSWEALQLPPQGVEAAGIKDAEMAMAKQLIDEMSAAWSADRFRDSFQAEVMKLVETKALAGHVEQVEKIDPSSTVAPNSANVVDLTELLQRSLGKKAAAAPATPGNTAAVKKPGKPRPRKAA